jgi:hypothetical protein
VDGCGGAPFESGLPRPEPQNAQNAVLCECTCESPFDPLAVPAQNFIALGSDDATQALVPGTAALTGSIIELGQNGLAAVRFQSIGVPPFATISEASNAPNASRLSNGICRKFTPPKPVSTESGMKIVVMRVSRFITSLSRVDVAE